MGKNESSTFAIKKSERGLTEMSFCKAQSEKNCESDLVFYRLHEFLYLYLPVNLSAHIGGCYTTGVTVNEQRVNDIFPEFQIEYLWKCAWHLGQLSVEAWGLRNQCNFNFSASTWHETNAKTLADPFQEEIIKFSIQCIGMTTSCFGVGQCIKSSLWMSLEQCCFYFCNVRSLCFQQVF